MDNLEGQLRKDPHVLAIRGEFEKRVDDMHVRLEATHYGTCVELCTSTWQKEQIVRVHCRAFFFTFGENVVPTPAASDLSRVPAEQVATRSRRPSWEECILRYLSLRCKEIWKPSFFFDGSALGAFPCEF